MLLFRVATVADALALTALLKQMGGTNEGAPDRAKALLDDPAHVLVVAELRGRLVGYAWAQSYGPHLRSGEVTARLHDLYVQAAQRGHGAGRGLFERVVVWAQDAGVTYLQWQASQAAVPFYARLGLAGDTVSDLREHPFYEMVLPVAPPAAESAEP